MERRTSVQLLFVVLIFTEHILDASSSKHSTKKLIKYQTHNHAPLILYGHHGGYESNEPPHRINIPVVGYGNKKLETNTVGSHKHNNKSKHRGERKFDSVEAKSMYIYKSIHGKNHNNSKLESNETASRELDFHKVNYLSDLKDESIEGIPLDPDVLRYTIESIKTIPKHKDIDKGKRQSKANLRDNNKKDSIDTSLHKYIPRAKNHDDSDIESKENDISESSEGISLDPDNRYLKNESKNAIPRYEDKVKNLSNEKLGHESDRSVSQDNKVKYLEKRELDEAIPKLKHTDKVKHLGETKHKVITRKPLVTEDQDETKIESNEPMSEHSENERSEAKTNSDIHKIKNHSHSQIEAKSESYFKKINDKLNSNTTEPEVIEKKQANIEVFNDTDTALRSQLFKENETPTSVLEDIKTVFKENHGLNNHKIDLNATLDRLASSKILDLLTERVASQMLMKIQSRLLNRKDSQTPVFRNAEPTEESVGQFEIRFANECNMEVRKQKT